MGRPPVPRPGAASRPSRPRKPGRAGDAVEPPGGAPALNTVVGVVATDAPLTKEQAQRVAWMAHDGLARAVRPSHTPGDGDVLFVLATGAAAGLAVPLAPPYLAATGAARGGGGRPGHRPRRARGHAPARSARRRPRTTGLAGAPGAPGAP